MIHKPELAIQRQTEKTVLGKPPAGHTQKRLQYTVEILWYFEVYKHIEEYSGILDFYLNSFKKVTILSAGAGGSKWPGAVRIRKSSIFF